MDKYANPLKNADSFSDVMSISQVVKFFERQGVFFTKTMIQNYVRTGVLAAPLGKRRYTKCHLALLVMIERLKDVFTLDELRAVLRPMNDGLGEVGLSEVALSDALPREKTALYLAYTELFFYTLNNHEQPLGEILVYARGLLPHGEDSDLRMVEVLMLAAVSAALKADVKKLIMEL